MHCYWQLLPVAERSPSELRLGNRVTHTYHANYPPKMHHNLILIIIMVILMIIIVVIVMIIFIINRVTAILW